MKGHKHQNPWLSDLKAQAKNPIKRICVACGAEHTPVLRRAKFCSAICRSRDFRARQNAKNKTPEQRAIRSAYLKRKNISDPFFRLNKTSAWTILRALKREPQRKNTSKVIAALPYTIPQLKAHLEGQFNNENGFTWENHGKAWEIDHVIPRSVFRYTSLDSKAFRDCWALANLRPLKKLDNQKKRNNLLRSSEITSD